MMAIQRCQIPVSFQYVPTTGPSSGDLVPVVGSSLTILDRNTNNPATLYQGFTGSGTIPGTPTTDTGGNVPGYVVEGSYSITAAATGSFTGATINWEAVRGDGVENIYPGAVNNAALASGAVTIDKLAAALQQFLVPTGTILDFSGSAAPAGFHLCDGSVQSQTGTYAALYAVIGSTYNSGGEGTGNFRLPNTQGRFSLGAGSGTSGHTNLNDQGGSLNHIHPLGTPATTIALGTPAVTVSVPGLSVPNHTHSLSGNGFVQLGISHLFNETAFVGNLSGAGSFMTPDFWYDDHTWGFFNIGFPTGPYEGFALGGNTDSSGATVTSGSTAGGSVNSGQTASGTVNSGQNTQAADPAYIVFNKIVKL